MSIFLIALPILCCLLIPAAIGVAALIFRKPGNLATDTDRQQLDLTHPQERDV